jgi:hypothetical protein
LISYFSPLAAALQGDMNILCTPDYKESIRIKYLKDIGIIHCPLKLSVTLAASGCSPVVGSQSPLHICGLLHQHGLMIKYYTNAIKGRTINDVQASQAYQVTSIGQVAATSGYLHQLNLISHLLSQLSAVAFIPRISG